MPTLFFIKNTTNMGLFCGKRCQDRKDMKTLLKFQNKFEKTDMRATKHTAKYNAHSIGYYNGIDPNKAKYEMWGKVGAAGFDALGKGLGPYGAMNKNTSRHSATSAGFQLNGNTLLMGFFAWFLFTQMNSKKRKKRR